MLPGKHRIIKILFLLMIIFILVEPASLAISRNEIQSKIRLARKKLQQTKKRERRVLGSLRRNQKELNRIHHNLRRLNTRLGKTQKKIDLLSEQIENKQKEIGSLQLDIEQHHEMMKTRLVTIYKYGYQSYLEVLLKARDFSQFVSRFEMVGGFIKADLAQVKKLKAQRQIVEQKKQDIIDRGKELERQENLYMKLKSQSKQEHNRWLSKVRKKKIELSAIQKNRKKLSRSLDELQKLSKRLEAQIRDMQNRNKLALGTGKMIWPVRGRITSRFGYRVHPILKKRKYHTGLDLAAPRGTKIKAADAGVVIFCRYNGGYGKMIIIDHGKNISSVYAHCHTLLVKRGQRVQKGNVIAKVGSTGLSTGPHLHFEIRQNGVPINPLKKL